MNASKVLAALAGLFTCISIASAQGLPPGVSYAKPTPVATAVTDWLSVMPAVSADSTDLMELLPRLYDYWAARNAYDRSACHRLITPDFTFGSEIGGDGFDNGEKALLDISEYSDRPDGTFRTGGRVLKVRKLFGKEKRIVVYLDETVNYTPATGGHSHIGPYPVAVTWNWKQTWVQAQGQWKISSVVNRA